MVQDFVHQQYHLEICDEFFAAFSLDSFFFVEPKNLTWRVNTHIYTYFKKLPLSQASCFLKALRGSILCQTFRQKCNQTKNKLPTTFPQKKHSTFFPSLPNQKQMAEICVCVFSFFVGKELPQISTPGSRTSSQHFLKDFDIAFKKSRNNNSPKEFPQRLGTGTT